MSLNAATIETLIAKGLSATDLLDVARAMEKRSDNTNAERQARYRANRKEGKSNGRYSNGVTPPNDNTLTPGSEAKASSPKYPPPEGVPDPVWRDFLNSPKRKKAGMNATAYDGICKNINILAEHGFPPGEMISLAVERGWVTVKPEWVINDGRKQGNSNHGGKSADGFSPTTRAALDVFGP
jgi:hypothetical protein